MVNEFHLNLIYLELDSSGFGLIDSSGNQVTTPGVEGLLTYNGGTVCDDGFTDNAAAAICQHLGFGGASSWTSSGTFYSGQEGMRINMDDISCSSTTWSECSFLETHNCRHGEDVTLSCLRNVPGFLIYL